MVEQEFRQALIPVRIPEIRYFDSVGSTMDEARQWMDNGAPDGALVIADQQIQGRGRLDRGWVTRKGVALAFTCIFHPRPREIQFLPLYAPLGGLAVLAAVQTALGLSAEIKWPNDVLVNRRKVCGILAETSWQDGHLNGVALGIGINIAPESIPPAEQLFFPATCLENEFGFPINRAEFLAHVVRELYSWREKLGSPEFFQSWEKSLAFKGEMVRIENAGETRFQGKLLGISEQGSLRIGLNTGEEILVEVGDVRLRPQDGASLTGGTQHVR